MLVPVLWLWCETRVGAELAGAFFMLFFAWNVAYMFEELAAKLSVLVHHGQAIHPF